jgi:hypothetical protein
MKAVENGGKLSSFYDYSSTCIDNVVVALSDIYYYQSGKVNNETLLAATKSEQDRIFLNIVNASTIAAEPANKAFYYCYRFLDSVETYTKKRIDTFVDFTDVYSSFLVNLLSESLAIRTYTVRLTDYENSQNWVSFTETFAQLFKAILNFESSTASARGVSLNKPVV